MGSSGYILRFTLIMTVITALILAGMFYWTEPYATRSEAVFNKRAILAAVRSQLGGDKFDELSDQQVLDIFEKQVEQVVVNMKGEIVDGMQAEKVNLAQEKKKPEAERLLPVFIYNNPDDSKKYYILSVRGNGLWDEIWGNIALESDLNTVAGASFDHKGETPGLGAEIKDNPAFPASFINKKINNEKGEFVSIVVRKGGARDPMHDVDAITGSTITSNGVTEMIDRGLKYYKPYLDKLKKS